MWLYQPPSTTPVTVTGAFADLFGRALPSEGRVSHRWKAWVHPEDQVAVSQAFEAGLVNGSYDQVFRVVLPDGRLRWLHDRALLLGALGVIRVTSDISPPAAGEPGAGQGPAPARERDDPHADAASEMSLVLDRLGRITDVGRPYAKLLGRSREDLLGHPFLDGVDAAQRDEVMSQFARLVAEPHGRSAVEWCVTTGADQRLWVEGTLRNLLGDPQVGGLVVSLREVTAHNQALRHLAERVATLESELAARATELEHANSRLRELDRLQRKVLMTLPDVFMRCSRDSTILDISGPEQQLVAPAEELLGARFVLRPELSDSVRALWDQTLKRALDTGRNQICDYPLHVLAGPREFEARFTPISNEEVAVIVRDVAERNRLRDRVEHVAMHDELTGLLNRNAIRERLDEQFARRPDAPVALLVIDLDRFKQVNDTLGHAIGDTLLKVVANRITRRAGNDSLRARLAGDEFALAIDCREVPEPRTHVEAFVLALITELGNRMRLHGESLYLTPSVGVAIYPRDARNADTLLRNADVAMMRAKELGRNSFQFYDPDIAAQASSLFNTEQSLRRALDEGQLACLYQPKIRVQDGTISGVEALVRWHAPDGQVLSPERFIPLAERTGLIKQLGHWVLREAIRQLAELPGLGRPLTDLAINVSAHQLRDSQFLGVVRTALTDFDFPVERLTLEIAETAFFDDMQVTADALAEIAHLGVRLSIDDFGTGYGGLSWLKTLPVQEIKIDRSFIKGCAIDAFDATIVSGLIEIAHNLGIEVVAEGVERADQIAFLTQVKCDVIQGFFLGMPMSLPDLARTNRLWQGPRV